MPLNHFPLSCEILAFRFKVLKHQFLLAAGAKEYDADWLSSGMTVMRDSGGKFASKLADSTATKVKGLSTSITDGLKKIQPQHTLNQAVVLSTSEVLEFLIKKYPESSDKMIDKMFGGEAKKIRKGIADVYREVNPKLADEIYQEPFPEIQLDLKSPISLKKVTDAFQYAVKKYNQTLEDLATLDEDNPQAVRVMGKLASQVIPVAVFLAATLAPEVAVGLLLEEGITAILSGYAVGQVAGAAAGKALDDAKIENPIARTGINIAVGIAAGFGIQQGFKALKPANAIKGSKNQAAKAVASAAQKQEAAGIAKLSRESTSSVTKKAISPTTSIVSKAPRFEDLKSNFLDNLTQLSIKNKKIPDYSWTDAVKQESKTLQQARQIETDTLLKEVGAYDRALEEYRAAIKNAGSTADDLNEIAVQGFRKGLMQGVIDAFENPNISLHAKARLMANSLDQHDGKWLPMRIPKRKAADAKPYEYINPSIKPDDPAPFNFISRYTGDELVYRVNNALRNADKQPIPKDIQEEINLIKQGLTQLPRARPHEPMARFIQIENPDKFVSQLKEGELYIDPAFQSFSPLSRGTVGYSDDTAMPVKFMVHPAEQSLGRDITHLNRSKEFEVLFPPSAKFRVVRKSRESFPVTLASTLEKTNFERWVIELEEVD